MSSPAPRILLALALLATFLASAVRGDPTREEIARWIVQLGDNDFATRQKASEQLWKAGRAAEALLEESVKSDDAEVSRRSRELLDKFRWGIYPDTPKKVVDLVTRYQSGDRNAKQSIIREMLDLGGAGCAVLLKMAHAEESEDMRAILLHQVAQEAPRAMPMMLVEGKVAELEELLDLSLRQEVESAVQTYVAYTMLRGRLDERIAHFQERIGQKGKPPAEEVLAWLYRAKGDLATARRMAEKSGKKDLLEWILYEQGDWKELVKRNAGVIGEQATELEMLSCQTAFQRLAGNKEGFATAVAAIQRYAADKAREETGETWLCAKALLLNDRPAEALALLREGRRNLAAAFEVYSAQMRFPEALLLVTRWGKEGSKDQKFLLVLQARLVYQLGDKDNALQLFNQLGEQLKDADDLPWYEEFIDTEMRVGLKKHALAHCAAGLGHAKDEATGPRLLGKVFPGKGDVADVWWKVLRPKYANESAAAVMKRVQAVLEGKAPATELEPLTTEPKQAKELTGEQLERWYLACADAWHAAGNGDQERRFLEKAVAVGGPAPALVRLGDFLAGKREWEQAADIYGKAWARDRRDPLPLHLQGLVLTRAGKEKEGIRLMELAHQLPLGDEGMRSSFFEALTERGLTDAARRERDFLFRIHAPGSIYGAEVLRSLATEALLKKDFLQAAEYDERAMLRVLRPYVTFVQPVAYVRVPEYIHRYRARGYVAAGRLEEARREIEAALAILPSDIELAILVVPELEKQGQTKEAAALFDRLYTLYEKFCKEYPQSAWGHNSLAWLSAACRRRLDAALEHGRKAVELEPDNSGYCDTLAEVFFQRGDQKEAVALMKKCIELDPKRVYYRKQLERFEKGDRNAELPPEGD